MNIPAFPIIPPFLRGVRGDRKGSPLSEITLKGRKAVVIEWVMSSFLLILPIINNEVIPNPRLISPFVEALHATSLQGLDRIDRIGLISGFGIRSQKFLATLPIFESS